MTQKEARQAMIAHLANSDTMLQVTNDLGLAWEADSEFSSFWDMASKWVEEGREDVQALIAEEDSE